MAGEKSIASQIRELGVGESLTLPYKSLRYVRTMVTFLNGSEESRRYASRSNSKQKTVEIIRQA